MSPSNYDRRVRRGLGVPQDYDPQAGPVADQSEPKEEPGPPRVAPRPMSSYTDEDYAAAARGPKPILPPAAVTWAGGPTKAPTEIKAPPQPWAGASLPESEETGAADPMADQKSPDVRRAATMGPPPVTMRQAPTPPPQGPPKPGEQEKAYQAMLQMGPRRSVLGTIAGAAMRFGAGYQNAGRKIGQDSIHLDQQRLDDWAQRNPLGPGSWREGVGRQKALSDAEQAQTKSDQDWQNQQVKNEDFRSQARERDKLGDFYGAHADVIRETQVDNGRERDLARIKAMGGTRPEVQTFPKGSQPPVGHWYIAEDPYNPGTMLAVRPHPGEQIDEDLANRLHISKAADGNYYLSAAAAARAYASDNSTETQQQRLERQRQQDDERKREFEAKLDETKANTQLTRQRIDDTNEERKQRGLGASQQQLDRYQRDEQDQHALRRAYGAAVAAKDGTPVIDPHSGQQVMMTPELRASYGEKYKTATDQVTRLQETQRKIIARSGGDAGPPPPRVPTVVGRDYVEKYAKEHGMSYDQAKRQAESEHFTVKE